MNQLPSVNTAQQRKKKKKMKDNLKTFKEKLEEWRKKDQGPKEQAYEVFDPEKNRFSLLMILLECSTCAI